MKSLSYVQREREEMTALSYNRDRHRKEQDVLLSYNY